MSVYAAFGKRVIDVVASAFVLAVAWPLMLAVACAIAIEDGRPIVFRQERVGRDGRPFTMLKFRSMPVTAPNLPSAEAKTVTVTRVGRFIRRTNLDELPQLINILRGDMSLIGPRPGLARQESLLAMRRERGVLTVRPGLTGLAQVNAYDGMPEAEKVDWEARYVARVTFLRDAAIVLRTVGYLLRPPPRY